MRRRIDCILRALICAALVVFGICTPCFAAQTPKSGNVFIGEGITPPEAVVKRDLIWAGSKLELGNQSIGNDLLAAGQSVTAAKASVGGSIRIAAQDIDIRACEVENNLTLAGQTIRIDGNTTVKGGAYLAGQSVTFAGAASDVYVAAQNVSIGGKVAANVTVYADTVFVQAGTQILGTLTVYSSNKPEISSKSEIGEYKFVQQETANDTIEGSLNSFFGFNIVNCARQILALAIAALLLALLFPRQFRLSAVMVRKRFGHVAACGVLGLLLGIPLLLLMLLISFEGGLALLFAYLAFALLAVPITAAILGPLLFKKMHRLLSSVLCAVLIALIGCIPAAGFIVWFACLLFAIGCIIQIVWAGMHTAKAPGGLHSLDAKDPQSASRVE